MRKILSHSEFTFTFELVSPLLIAAEDVVAADVGGIDKVSILNPLDNQPFIPPSSFKGKLRYLCCQLLGDTGEIDGLFGTENAKLGGSVVNIKELKCIWAKETSSKEYFFVKTEASVNRLNSNANPRLFQVIVPHGVFTCTILINIYDNDENPEDIVNNIIKPALSLLEDDYLGSGGSRGLGQIKILEHCTVSTHNEIKAVDDIYMSETRHHIVHLWSPYLSSMRLPSTTIAGCFASAMAHLGCKNSEITQFLLGENTRISSAFPVIKCSGGSKKIYFYPRPHYYVKGIKTHTKNKKAFLDGFNYISGTLLNKFIANHGFLYDLCDQLGTSYKIKDHLCMTSEEYAEIASLDLYKDKNLMHVSIDPDTGTYKEKDGKGQLFNTSDCFIGEEYGFFFLISHRFNDSALKGILDKIELMGIGADKSSGKGYFKFEFDELSSKDNWLFHVSNDKEGAKHMVLSLVHPSVSDRKRIASSVNSYYKVITRKGKRENSYMEYSKNPRIEKDRIFVFQEGSIFDFAIDGSSPPVCSERAPEVKDFGFAYRIALPD